MSKSPVGVHVECYAGYRGEETPRALVLGERRIEVAAVLDQWLAPDHRYFKIQAVSGDVYIVRHDVASGGWALAAFRSGSEELRQRRPGE